MYFPLPSHRRKQVPESSSLQHYPQTYNQLSLPDSSDAVLFSAVGDPKFDNDPTAKVRPEQGLLAMRRNWVFSNIRPVQTFKCLIHKSPLRAELVDNADFICIP